MGRGLADLKDALGEVEIKEAPLGAKPETKKDKLKSLESVTKTLNKQFDTTMSLVRCGDKVGLRVPSINTNLPTLDYTVIGSGGIPRGRIIEIFGPESSGKTTLALQIIAAEQKATDNLAVFVDAEHALDINRASQLGVDVDNLFIAQPDSGEQALETVEELIRSRAVSVIVVDSVSALVPQAELDGEMGDSHVGLQARLMSQAMRKLIGLCQQTSTTVIFINQIREKIGVMYGSPETTSGGRALKFYASLRLDIRRKEAIKQGDTVIGHIMKIKCVKSKVGAPMKETLINLYYDERGVDTFADTIEYAVTMGVIERSGAWYSFQGDKLGQGLEKSIDTLRGDSVRFSAVLKTLEKLRSETVENKGNIVESK